MTIKKVKGLKVTKQLVEKFKFDNEGRSKFGSHSTDTHALTGELRSSGTLELVGDLILDRRISNALFGAPQLDGATETTELQDLINNISEYEGFMVYLTNTGSSPVGPFLKSQKFYFCENGEWHPSPFAHSGSTNYNSRPVPANSAQTDADGDGVPDHQDAFPNDPAETTDTDLDGVGDNADPYPSDPFLTFTPTRQHRFYFWDQSTQLQKNLSSENGHLQFSKYKKLSSNFDWSTAANDGGHGWPPGDGTWGYTTSWAGWATGGSNWWKYCDWDTRPDDNIYTMDLDLPVNYQAGYGVNMFIGNVDVSSDPEGLHHIDWSAPEYVWFKPYPEMGYELDNDGNPTGIRYFKEGGRLKIQLKHALDDKIYIRIAHGATEEDIDIESMEWIDSSLIDADGDNRPVPYDIFPADGSEWIDKDSDGLGSNAESQLGTDDYNPDTDGDTLGDNEDAFPLSHLRWIPTRQHQFFSEYDWKYNVRVKLSSSSGWLQYGAYDKLEDYFDTTNPLGYTNSDGSGETWQHDHGHPLWPRPDGTISNRYCVFDGRTNSATSHGSTYFDTRPDDDEIYSYDLWQLPEDHVESNYQWEPVTFGKQGKLRIGNIDVSSDYDSGDFTTAEERSATHPAGYVELKLMPPMITETDENGNPIGAPNSAFPQGGRLRVQLKHASDDKIYVRIGHSPDITATTDTEFGFDTIPWTEENMIDTDYDNIPSTVDQTSSQNWPHNYDYDADGIYEDSADPTSAYDADSDNDGVLDGVDQFPIDPSEWTDTDGDGTGDNADAFPIDPNYTTDTPPIVELNGLPVHYILKDEVYFEWGALATDVEEFLPPGDANYNQDYNWVAATISGDVVDTSTLGTYNIDYSHTDIHGNTTTVTRSVHVVEPDSTAPSYFDLHWNGLNKQVEVRYQFHDPNKYDENHPDHTWPESRDYPWKQTGQGATWITGRTEQTKFEYNYAYGGQQNNAIGTEDANGDPVFEPRSTPNNSRLGRVLIETTGQYHGDNQITIEFRDNSGNVLHSITVWDPPQGGWGNNVRHECFFQCINGTVYVDGQAVVVYDTVAQDWVSADADGDGIADDIDPFVTETTAGGEINTVLTANSIPTNDPIFEQDSTGNILITAAIAGETNGNFEVDANGNIVLIA